MFLPEGLGAGGGLERARGTITRIYLHKGPARYHGLQKAPLQRTKVLVTSYRGLIIFFVSNKKIFSINVGVFPGCVEIGPD